jgi:hypothetical protein
MFLTSKLEAKQYFQNLKTKTFLMNSFYIWQCKRLNLFIDDNQNPTQVQLPPKAQAQKLVNNRPIQVQRAARKR